MKEILYDWGGANVWLFHLINDLRFPWLDRAMLLGTALGDHALFPWYLGLLTLSAGAAARAPGREPLQYRVQAGRWMAVVAVFSCAYLCDGLLLAVLKPALDFPRPPLALPPGTVQIVGKAEFHHSLPSGHASFAMLVAASLWPVLNRSWRAAGMVFVLWVGISRISLGAHFPADVIAGFLSSLAVVLLVQAATHKLMQLVADRTIRFRSGG
jgi:membrane-associated phospholipid phosphatase